jgi:hypothetical protein
MIPARSTPRALPGRRWRADDTLGRARHPARARGPSGSRVRPDEGAREAPASRTADVAADAADAAGPTPSPVGGGRIRLADGRIVPWDAARIRSGRVVVSVSGAGRGGVVGAAGIRWRRWPVRSLRRWWRRARRFRAVRRSMRSSGRVRSRGSLPHGGRRPVRGGVRPAPCSCARGRGWASGTKSRVTRRNLGAGRRMARQVSGSGSRGRNSRCRRTRAEADATRSNDESRTVLRAILLGSRDARDRGRDGARARRGCAARRPVDRGAGRIAPGAGLPSRASRPPAARVAPLCAGVRRARRPADERRGPCWA